MKNIHHHIRRALSKPEFVKILILRTVGNFLVLSSIFMIVKTFYQPVFEEVRYFIDQKTEKTYVVAAPAEEETIKREFAAQQPKGGLADLLRTKKVEVLVPQDTDFSIVIPKIGANSRVQANVDAADEQAYLEALKQGVAHVSGSAFPGESGHIFLFAHSTDYVWNVGTYNAIFYLLYKLERGDEVDLFYKGQRYTYRIVDKALVDPSQIEYLTRKTNREFLTLQTCWPPGTTLKRLLMFATRVRE